MHLVVDGYGADYEKLQDEELVRTFLDEHQSQMDLMLERYAEFAGLLRGQEELALGFGMFEALHLNDGGERSSRGTVDDVLSVLD